MFEKALAASIEASRTPTDWQQRLPIGLSVTFKNVDFDGEQGVVTGYSLNLFDQPLVVCKKTDCSCHEVLAIIWEGDLADPELDEFDRRWLEGFKCDCLVSFYPHELTPTDQ